MPRYQEMAFWCDTVFSAELFWTSDWTECPAPGKQLRSGLQIQRSCFPSAQAAFTKYFWRCTRLDVECLCREAVRPLSVSLVCFHHVQVSWPPRCACRDSGTLGTRMGPRLCWTDCGERLRRGHHLSLPLPSQWLNPKSTYWSPDWQARPSHSCENMAHLQAAICREGKTFAL